MDAVDTFQGMVRGSGLGYCPRRIAYTALTGDGVQTREAPGTPSANHRFDDGHWHEFDIKRRMGYAGVQFLAGVSWVLKVKIPFEADWWVPGHVDGVVQVPGDTGERWLPGGLYIHEAKSMASGSYWRFVRSKYREGFPSYFDQIQGYLHSQVDGFSPMMDEDTPVKDLYHGLVIFEDPQDIIEVPKRALITAKNKDNGNIFSEVIEADEAHFVGLRRRWIMARAAVSAGELPDRLHGNSNNFECRECVFKEECWEEGGVVVPVALPPGAEDAAKLLKVGKALEKIATQMVEAAEQVLTPEDVGKVEVDGVKVNKYLAKSVKWDHKRLERDLPEGYLNEVRVETTSARVRRDVPQLTPGEVRELIGELQSGDQSRYLIAGGG